MIFYIKIPEDGSEEHVAFLKSHLIEHIIKDYPNLTIKGLDDNSKENGVPAAMPGDFLAFGIGNMDVSCINKESLSLIPKESKILVLGNDDEQIAKSVAKYNSKK